jgi:hypothetical protein
MVHTTAFFRHVAHPTGLRSANPVAERYPFHDHAECPVGQAVKKSGQWQYYVPTHATEKRPRCPLCEALNTASR